VSTQHRGRTSADVLTALRQILGQGSHSFILTGKATLAQIAIKEIHHILMHLPQVCACAHVLLAGVNLVLDRLVIAAHGLDEAAQSSARKLTRRAVPAWASEPGARCKLASSGGDLCSGTRPNS
jgi:hypothetical protein